MKILFILMATLFFISASYVDEETEKEIAELEKCVSKHCTFEGYKKCLDKNAPLTCMKRFRKCVQDALEVCEVKEK